MIAWLPDISNVRDQQHGCHLRLRLGEFGLSGPLNSHPLLLISLDDGNLEVCIVDVSRKYGMSCFQSNCLSEGGMIRKGRAIGRLSFVLRTLEISGSKELERKEDISKDT